MINRYDRPLEQIRLVDGRVVYKTSRPTAVQPIAGNVNITIGEQDRFDILAHNIYGKTSSWWIIASANGQVNGSLTVPIGTNVIIPPK